MIRLGLGTAQFGSTYGITNRSGRSAAMAMGDILDRAISAGIRVIDTAPAYGQSEQLLGRALSPDTDVRIVTKTKPIGGRRVEAADVVAVRDEFHRSLERLRRSTVEALLVHQPRDLARPGAVKLAEQLVKLRDEGFVRSLGASIYGLDDLHDAERAIPLDLVQLPLSVLDQRLLDDGTIARLNQAGVEIHARSVFLQGLLLASPRQVPPRLRSVAAPLERFRLARRELGLSALEAALGFVAHVDAVEVALVGVNSVDELEQCIAAADRAEGVALDWPAFASLDPRVIDPRRWTT